MRRKPLLIALGIVALVIAGIVVYAVNQIQPADVFRLAAEKIKEQTGRELKVDGKIAFSISLEPTISLEGVRFQNASWGSRPDMLMVKRIDVGIALLPLLSGHVDVRGLTLIEPDLLLETDANGVGNWKFASSTAKPPASDGDSGSQQVNIHHAEIEKGVVAFRSTKDKTVKRLELPQLEAKTSGAKTILDGEARLNGEAVAIDATLDRSATPMNIVLSLKTPGLILSANGALNTANTDAARQAQIGLEVSDWKPVARLAGMDAIALPALKLEGRLVSAANVTSIEGLKATLGKSSFAGTVRFDPSRQRPSLDIDLTSPRVDLAELLGPADKSEPTDGRVFSSDPLPVAALRAADGKLRVGIDQLALRDGKTVEGVDFQAVVAQGKVAAGPVRISIEGKELRMQANLDASSGDALGANLSVEGRGIPLGALGALLNISGAPAGSPTDVSIRFSGRGDSVRTLMAGANADIRIVVGPGRLPNRIIDWGADVTELLNAINPGRASEAYTDLKCAVVRLPIRRGVARVENSIAAETGKVNVIAAGVIDFRNESLDLGIRPKAATGLGVGLGGLASLGRLRGTFAQPKVQLDMSETAQTAAQIGLAAATGGLSLLAGGLLADSVPDHPCQVALTGKAPRSATPAPQSTPSVVDEVVDGIKKLFGR
jgi:uncharacterized protein involved in outer membrane biogenesis